MLKRILENFISRPVRRLIVLLLLLIVLAAIAVYAARATQRETTCMQLDTDSAVWTIDTQSGERFFQGDGRPGYQAILTADRKYAIYRSGQRDKPQTLWVEPYSGPRIPNADCEYRPHCWVSIVPKGDQAFLVERNIENLSWPIQVAQQGRFFGYTWQQPDGKLAFAVVDPEQRTRHVFRDSLALGDVRIYDWSEDGSHVAFGIGKDSTYAGSRTVYLWSLAEGRFLNLSYVATDPHIPLDRKDVTLSPNGRNIAYIVNGNPAKPMIASLDLENTLTFELPTVYESLLTWSPDSRYVAARYDLDGNRSVYLDVFGLDGKAFRHNLVTTTNSGSYVHGQWEVWAKAAGSTLLIFQHHVTALSLPEGQSQELVRNRKDTQILSDGSVVVSWQTNKAGLDIISPDGKSHRTLVDDAKEIYLLEAVTPSNPFVYVAVYPSKTTLESIYLDGTGRKILGSGTSILINEVVSINNGRSIIFQNYNNGNWSIAVVDIDGQNHFVLADNIFTMARASKLPDDRHYVYLASRGNTLTLELVDAQLRTHKILTDDVSFDYYAVYPESGQIVFDWEKPDGGAGFDGYQPDGQRMFRVKIIGTKSDINYTHSRAGVFVAPDRRIAAVIPMLYESNIQLAALDGSGAHPVQTGGSGRDVTWSSDSKQFAVYGGDTISLHSSDGVFLKDFKIPEGNIVNAEWTRCDP